MAGIQKLLDSCPRECPHRYAELIAQFFGFWPISVKNNINQQLKLEKEKTGVMEWKIRREKLQSVEDKGQKMYSISVGIYLAWTLRKSDLCFYNKEC